MSAILCQEITDRAIDELDEETAEDLLVWLHNGGDSTIREFRALDPEMQREVMAFLEDFELYEELVIKGKRYLLVHGGLGHFSPEKEMNEYSLKGSCLGQTELSEKIF